MIHPEYNRDALAVIGGIIVTWAAIEKQVASSVQMIEMELAVAANAWPPQYTDLSSLRGFKERKGHLRRLIENHGSAADLRALDQIFQRLTKPAEARHAFGHDLVNIMPKGNDGPQLINILNLGNIADRKSTRLNSSPYCATR